jgi:hypothetical protein
VIIVEGADNTGKTTLITELLKLDPNLHLLARKKYRPERGESIGTSYLKMLDAGDVNGVADRCMASECIYGVLFRDGCRMTVSEHAEIREQLFQHRAIIVWCNPPNEVIERDWHARPQLYTENPLRIANAYRQMLPRLFSGFNIVQYDWSRCDAMGFTAARQRQQLITHHKYYQRNLHLQQSLESLHHLNLSLL